MKSSSLKYFLISGVTALLCLVAFPGMTAFSTTSQEPTLSPSQPSSSLTPEGAEESGDTEQPAPFDIQPVQYSGERVKVGRSQWVGPSETVGNLVTVFGAAEMEGKTEREMVTVFGNSKMTGETGREMVTVFGNATMTGDVGREMVTVFGSANMSGNVKREMVTVFGDAEINGRVDGDVVVVFGSLKLGQNAVVNRECMAVFGKIERDPGATVMRDVVEIMPWLSGLKSYVMEGPLLGRLLPPGSVLAWIVVALHFILYLLVAVILPKPTADGVRQLEASPLLCFGVGLLTMILMAPLSIILIATGIGILLLPFIGLAETAFMILGKASVLEFFGLQILRRFDSDPSPRPVMGFLAGFILVTLVYMVPILGLLVWILLRPLALGAAMLAVFKNVKKNGNGTSSPGVPVRSAPEQAAAPHVPPPPPVDPHAPGESTLPPSTPDSGRMLQDDSKPIESTGAIPPETVVMQRAGFWIRLAATALDFILLVWLLPVAHEYFLLFWLAYHVAMWTWKGTTIGGIICKLKVVRLDGTPVDPGVSLVRSLASFFSVAALGLGFFWAGWTRERQAWHDLIAGTVIVRVPHSMRLI